MRVEHVLELLAEHIKSGLSLDEAASGRQPARGIQAGQVDPVEAGHEPRAPDHIGDVEDDPVLRQRPAIDDPCDACRAFNAGGVDPTRSCLESRGEMSDVGGSCRTADSGV